MKQQVWKLQSFEFFKAISIHLSVSEQSVLSTAVWPLCLSFTLLWTDINWLQQLLKILNYWEICVKYWQFYLKYKSLSVWYLQSTSSSCRKRNCDNSFYLRCKFSSLSWAESSYKQLKNNFIYWFLFLFYLSVFEWKLYGDVQTCRTASFSLS